ncbi:MAG: helicase-exonuclease AddAB subunit AddA [Bacillota bacterium]|nr:helicase-exonuclease AddAB subunit AddA [Bacillota bacterium]
MATKFTPEQQMAIDLRSRNILVCAAAGSGKTAVLVQRIIGLVTDEKHPMDIDRLLVVTFTNAAAAEMRERIGTALEERLEREPENVHLQKQMSLLHNAQITTIDSFCLFLIRNNFNDIGLDPGFRIADEGELTLLGQDVLSQLLEQQYQEKRPEFINCMEYFSTGSNDRLIEEYIEKLYQFSMSYPWPEDWIGQCQQEYKISDVTEMENSEWCQYIVRYMKTIVDESVRDLEFAITLAEEPEGPYMYGEMLEQEREMLLKLSAAETLSDYYRLFETISFGRLPSKRDASVDPVLRERVQQLRKDIKKRLEDVKENYLTVSPEQAVKRMQKAAPAMEELLSLVLTYKRMLDERKRRDNIIDFHDMEHLALKILLLKQEDGSLIPSPAALEYRQHFGEVLIDEYQDSNLVQELILKSISGEDEEHYNRFMVGDVKQSIYRFRLARPELFMEKYNCYSKQDSCCQRIDLHKNFRSRHQVLNSVNQLFSQIMGRNLGGVEYDAEAALYPGAVFPEQEAGGEESGEAGSKQDPYETEYLMIGKNEQSSLSARQQEAAAIARKIRELYAALYVTDKETGKMRPVRYSDMVILLRTTAGWAEEFKSVLEKEGIPAYVASRTGYFQTVEIKVLLQLLHVIDNPYQDIPLYGVMKSFFGGFSQEEIAKIRAVDQKIPLYELLVSYDGEEKAKVADFLNRLSVYRKKTAYTPIHKLIQEILSDTGYLDYVSARPGGEQRRANVEMLLTRAAAFEQTSYYGLFHFLRYIEQLEKYEVDYGEADVLDENADVVRIMSIHKSKGLEFPVCIVAGLSKRFNMQDTASRLIADADMGIGVDYIDSSLRIQSRTLKKRAVALKMRLDALGEEMRVLYVAMTRAKEKLILTAMTNDLDKLREELELQRDRVSFSALAGASCYLDFIIPCLKNPVFISSDELMLEDIREAAGEISRKQRLLNGQGSQSIMTELSEKFNRNYSHQYLSGLFVKTTVSELKMKAIHGQQQNWQDKLDESMDAGGSRGYDSAFTRELFEEPEIVPYIPSFISSKEGMSGTDRGSAYHKVMELLDLEAAGANRTKEELAGQLDELVRQEKLTQQWRDSVSETKLMTFLDSSLARRMRQASLCGRLRREQPFVMGIGADRLDQECPASEQVLIQGIIDVFFEENGKIIVADYKTDAVKAPEELVRRYQTQLDYYAEALHKLTGKEVTEKIIYSFALGTEIAL